MPNLYDFELEDIRGEKRSLRDFQGQVVLCVNVASRCGLTPQYDGLQRIYERYHERGFEILGFPCNQFAGQEPGRESEIQEFCRTNYGVTFPLFSKIDVNGDGRHPLYAWLTSQSVGPEESGDIRWNFGKFLIGRDGEVQARFEPTTEPGSAELQTAIEKALES